jgi:hypothetical protein
MTLDRSEQYAELVEFMLEELGQTFEDRPSNINALATHLGISRRQVHSVLGTMTKRSVLRWDRIGRAWTVTKRDGKAANAA